METLSAYQVDGFVEWLVSFFGLIPVGVLLGLMLAVLGFGIFKLLSLIGKL